MNRQGVRGRKVRSGCHKKGRLNSQVQVRVVFKEKRAPAKLSQEEQKGSPLPVRLMVLSRDVEMARRR